MTTPQPGFRLDGKVAVVTGAGRGLGKAVAIALTGAGAKVVLVSRSADELNETAAEIRAAAGVALPIPLDVTADGSADRALRAATENFGGVDILVASAGTAVTAPAFDLTAADWDRVHNVNLRAAFFWSRACGYVMAGRGGGRVIFLTSVLGLVGSSGLAAYSASKGGLIALARALAVEWSQMGITVNAIAPGYVRTALNADALANEKVLHRITSRTPMGRLGQAEEVAAAAIFLASDSAAYVTGHVLSVDGGWLAS